MTEWRQPHCPRRRLRGRATQAPGKAGAFNQTVGTRPAPLSPVDMDGPGGAGTGGAAREATRAHTPWRLEPKALSQLHCWGVLLRAAFAVFRPPSSGRAFKRSPARSGGAARRSKQPLRRGPRRGPALRCRGATPRCGTPRKGPQSRCQSLQASTQASWRSKDDCTLFLGQASAARWVAAAHSPAAAHQPEGGAPAAAPQAAAVPEAAEAAKHGAPPPPAAPPGWGLSGGSRPLEGGRQPPHPGEAGQSLAATTGSCTGGQAASIRHGTSGRNASKRAQSPAGATVCPRTPPTGAGGRTPAPWCHEGNRRTLAAPSWASRLGSQQASKQESMRG
jgi:hypothetical protein